jgi:hypothetical protein
VPDLMQVYLIPAETAVELSLVHLVPALVAAFDGDMGCSRKITTQNPAIKRCFI